MPDSDTSSLENFRPPVKLKLCMLLVVWFAWTWPRVATEAAQTQ